MTPHNADDIINLAREINTVASKLVRLSEQVDATFNANEEAKEGYHNTRELLTDLQRQLMTLALGDSKYTPRLDHRY